MSAIFTDWKPVTEGYSEYFQFGNMYWNIEQAKRILIAKPRRSGSLPVADWKGFSALTGCKPGSVDLSIPVICVKFGNGYLPVDGWNRIRLALNTGITSLPFVLLTVKEEKEIRFD
jgi:hypothetical protein